MGKNIVIVGAGYAGVLTAKKLAKRLKHADVHITLIDRHPYHTMLTELHEVAANRVPEDHIRISLKKIFAGRKVDVKLDTVTAVDYDNKTVTGKTGSYSYDYLVMATGSKPTFFGTPGADEFSYKLWSFDNAVRLKHHIIDMFKAAASETDPAQKRRLLTFYIVGAGFTGAELMKTAHSGVTLRDIATADFCLCGSITSPPITDASQTASGARGAKKHP
jgi:NADH dehydrogenase